MLCSCTLEGDTNFTCTLASGRELTVDTAKNMFSHQNSLSVRIMLLLTRKSENEANVSMSRYERRRRDKSLFLMNHPTMQKIIVKNTVEMCVKILHM